MRRAHRSVLASRELPILVALGLTGAIILGALLWADVRWSAIVPGGGSFFSLWAGSRQLLSAAGQPYDASVALAAQDLAYGRPATAGENPYWLDVPLFLVLPIVPLAEISQPVMARGIWMMASQLAMASAMLLSLRVIEWPAPRRTAIFLGLFGAFNAYSVLSVQEGTPAALLTMGYSGILWSLRYDRDELAGCLVALSLLKWEIGLPFLLLIAWYVLHERRWRVLAGAAMTLTILLAISFLIRPGWLLPFMTAAIAMVRSEHGLSLASALKEILPSNGIYLTWSLAILAATAMLIEWAIGQQAGFQRFAWMAYLAIAATPLLGLRSEIFDLSPMLPCYAVMAAATTQRRGAGVWVGPLLLGAAFFAPWILLVESGGVASLMVRSQLFIFLPVLTSVGLYWTRWWLLHPARTWLDQVRTSAP